MTARLSLRVGNQSAFSAEPWTLPFDFALSHGFEAFEWFPDRKSDGAGFSISDIATPQRQELRARARDAGITLSVHAPVHADPLRAGKELEESLRLAVDLGASLLNTHLTAPSRIEEFANALAPLAQRCTISGVKLAIENTPTTSPEDFNRLFALLPRNGVGMCLDIGHANLYQGTHNDYIAYLDQLAPTVPIIHLHLHENYGDRDSHLVLFTGPAGRNALGVCALLDRMRRRGFSGCAILEQWPKPPESLIEARDRLMALVRAKEQS